MGKRIDLTGQRFGRLVVISYNEEVSKQKSKQTKRAYWNCKCDCGNEVVARGDCLKSGNTNSCGCYQKEKTSETTKEMWKDENFRQARSNESSKKMKKMWENETFRQVHGEKMKEKMKEKWEDENFRKMKSERIREQWNDKEFRQARSNESSKKMKKMWAKEDFRQMHHEKRGEKHPNWKGGITPITNHLRTLEVVIKWRGDCQRKVNYICELSGKKTVLNVHHLKAFSTIVAEAHKLHNIQIKPQVKDYTQDELRKLEEYIASWHKDSSNAVVLCEEVHTLFHSLYGKGGNTPEQYIEFKQRYLSGEFNEILK